jgi:Protein of unknown function (DUF1761)
MLFLIWLVLCFLGIALILLPAAIWISAIYRRYAGSRLVACPENQHAAVVGLDLRHAAATGVHGHPDLRLCNCTRWPERANCGQPCLSQAVQAEAYTPAAVDTAIKRIYHLPILLAAFAAWCLGAIWHAQYLFRPGWTNAVGLTRAQVKEIVWWISPHLLTLAACLLFAYGVAWLLAAFHRRGVLQGILMALLLGGMVALANVYGIAKVPSNLLALEAGYVILAVLVVGSIVGGLYNRLVLPSR